MRRNIGRFPADFMLSLTREEIRNLSQSVISSGIKHAPKVFAFTEQGVAMISTVLNSERAIQVNIAIMRAFVKLGEIFSAHTKLASKLAQLERKIGRHDEEIKLIFDAIRQLMSPAAPKRKKAIRGNGGKNSGRIRRI